jgi:hypothetical protein
LQSSHSESCLPRSGLAVSKCVREDRGLSQNRQGGLREYRQSRIEGVNDSATMSGLDRPLRASFGTCFVTPNKPVRVEEKPASPSSRCRASRPIGSPVEFSLSSAFPLSSSWQNGLSPLSVTGDPMAQCRDRDRSLRSGSKRVQDCHNRGSENSHWFVTLVELTPQKWPQKVAIATHIMASARSRECMLLLINK